MQDKSATDLIAFFREEHALLCGMLARVFDLQPNSAAGRDAATDLCVALLSHLEVEDAVLYPRLRAHSDLAPDVSATTDTFFGGLLALRSSVDELRSLLAASQDIAPALDRLAVVLETRLDAEEQVLFRLLEHLEAAAD